MLNKNQRYEYCTVDFLCKSLHTCTNMMTNIIEKKTKMSSCKKSISLDLDFSTKTAQRNNDQMYAYICKPTQVLESKCDSSVSYGCSFGICGITLI